MDRSGEKEKKETKTRKEEEGEEEKKIPGGDNSVEQRPLPKKGSPSPH